MTKTKEELKVSSITVRDEIIDGRNTATRVGQLLLDMVESFLLSQEAAETYVTDKEAETRYLRKNKEDTAEKLIKFLSGSEFGVFTSGETTGKGAKIFASGHAEFDSIMIRKWLDVPEIRYNRIQVVGGELWVTDGAKFDTVTRNGTQFYDVKLKLEEGEGVSLQVDDILKGTWIDKGTDGKFKGFTEVWFRVTAVNQDTQTITVSPRDANYPPQQTMEVARTGNFSNVDRQRSILVSGRTTCITFLDGVNGWEIHSSMEKCWIGRKEGSIAGVPDTSGYNAKLSNVIVSGKIYQVDDDGEEHLIPIDKGAWVEGVKYNYYDRVRAAGGLWLCVNEKGTTARPTEGSADWLLQIADGSTPEPAGTWNSYTQYGKTQIVTHEGNGYIATADNIGVEPIPNPGGYLMTAGKYLTTDGKRLYTGIKDHPWQLLAKAGDKGEDATQIIWQDPADSHPADPKEGWAYRNTRQGVTYIYLGGQWHVMAMDGQKGDNGIQAQFSVDGSAWHDTYQPDDIFMRLQMSDGTWTDAMRVVGEDGQEGRYTSFQFAAGDSATVPPTSGWQDAPPTVKDGQYLWMRSGVVIPPATVPDSWTPIRISGDKGDKGINYITVRYSPYASYKEGDVVSFNGGMIYCKKDNTGQLPVPFLVNNGKYLMSGGKYLLYKALTVDTIDSKYWDIFVAPPVVDKVILRTLTSDTSVIRFNSIGNPVPSSFVVNCRKQVAGSSVLEDCTDLYMVYRVYADSTYISQSTPSKTSAVTISNLRTDGRYFVRAYEYQADATAWNSNFISEYVVTYVRDGQQGAAGAIARPRGQFIAANSEPYIWNDTYRDVVYHSINGVNILFQVKNYGASVTAAPTSANGDNNWESAQQFRFVATDLLLADQAVVNVASGNEIRVVDTNSKVLAGFTGKGDYPFFVGGDAGANAVTRINKAGKLFCNDAEITGTINATAGIFSGYISTPFKNIEESDAVRSGYTYTIKNDLNLIGASMPGEIIILPIDPKYNGSVIHIFNPAFPPYTKTGLMYSTSIRAADGEGIGNTIDYDLASSNLDANLITELRIIGGCYKFLGVPVYTYDNSGNRSVLKTKWLALNYSIKK